MRQLFSSILLLPLIVAGCSDNASGDASATAQEPAVAHQPAAAPKRATDLPVSPARAALGHVHVLEDCDCQFLPEVVFSWTADEPGLRQTPSVSVTKGEGELTLTRLDDTENSGGWTNGANFRFNEPKERIMSGNTIRAQFLMEGKEGETVKFAFSTADRGNSGWISRTLGGGEEWVEFTYKVPVLDRGNYDYIGILPPVDGSIILREARVLIDE